MADTVRLEIRDGKVSKRVREMKPIRMVERKRWLFFGLPFTFTTYTLTNKKLTINSGFIRTVEDDILLYRVSDLRLTRNLLQRIFNLGTIVVVSSDKSVPQLELHNIRNFRKFKDLLEKCIEHDKLRVRFRSAELLGGDSDMTDTDF